MRRSRGTLTAATVSLLLLSACAGTATADGTAGPGGPSDASSGPATAAPSGDGLALRVTQTGGFAGVPTYDTRLPTVSVYADGRVVTQGPQAAVYPGPALPHVVVQKVDPAQVGTLTDKAIAAGVGSAPDLGRPSISDATTTRFTLRVDAGEVILDAYALAEASGAASGLTPAQEAARKRLSALLDELSDVPGTLGVSAPEQAYVATALAAVARPYQPGTDPATSAQPAIAWPGPALPGPAVGTQPGVSCVTVSGADVGKVLSAAKGANTMTPWTSGGKQWSVALRPLLPDEADCDALRRAA